MGRPLSPNSYYRLRFNLKVGKRNKHIFIDFQRWQDQKEQELFIYEYATKIQKISFPFLSHQSIIFFVRRHDKINIHLLYLRSRVIIIFFLSQYFEYPRVALTTRVPIRLLMQKPWKKKQKYIYIYKVQSSTMKIIFLTRRRKKICTDLLFPRSREIIVYLICSIHCQNLSYFIIEIFIINIFE